MRFTKPKPKPRIKLEDEPVDEESVVTRLLLELRQAKKILEGLSNVLYTYVDLDRMTTLGAAHYLVRQAKLVEAIRSQLKIASKNPDNALAVLMDIEKLINESTK